MANIRVAVRVRPISARELNGTGSEVVVRTELNGISLTNLKVSPSKAGDSRGRVRRYGFDYCFDSSDPDAENFADQARIYETVGQTVLEAVLSGYNSCLVAYGQSASGKTYTMMGTKEDPGLTPRLCEGLFAGIEENRKNQKNCRVSISYLEIYNERVRDLLKPSSSASGLRVREHPRLGPYVQGLTHHVAPTLGSLMSYVEEGTKARKTASTLQNPSSSRSHALLTIAVTPESPSVAVGASSSARRSEGLPPRGGSKLRLVDLAGSENAATCGGVHRLKEGANINKSLVALGNVISALAERGSTGSGPGRRFIPYRDSSLTWLLKDALGGNATTIMLATISPASGSYNETAHTLRFAQRAQSVVNRPVVNEDPVARLIRELRAEVARLSSLLLEKNIEPNKALCSCGKNQDQGKSVHDVSESATIGETVPIERSEELNIESNAKGQAESKTEEQQLPKSVTPLRRSTSTESLAIIDPGSSLKRFGSYEFLGSKDRLGGGYNRAKVTELNDEEDEVNEIHESVFVDIPTLVAVLIKPDDSLQESSAQIEEICSDEAVEDGIDVEFIDTGNDREPFEDADKPESIDHDERSSSVNSCHASGDYEIDVYRTSSFSRVKSASKLNEKPKFRKQDSVDLLSVSLPTNIHTSKKFGSVETIHKKKEPVFSLERSHTNLERRSAVPERAKKLNNIREIEDQKIVNKNLWGKELLQRKGSNDSDKSLKESSNQIVAKGKGHARKPSLECLKRKTSKDSSSSSSKDEQILISSLTREKLLHRKDSIDQESSSSKTHTPIQRAKRAEIVAAVTERLYSAKKPPDDASGVRSPPEGTEVKSLARMKLQEISRKMLGKRRRVCVDTQTECSRTVRMRDTASLTETPEINRQDVAVLTEDHEGCEIVTDKKPVLRVKEMSTLTDKPRTDIVRCKDVASLVNDLDEFEYDIHSPRNDSGILSDDTQNYAESNLSSTEVSDVCPMSGRGIPHADSSTNTLYSSCRSFAVQTPRSSLSDQRRIESKAPACLRQCCNPEPGNLSSIGSAEKSVISISLPDTISITIESTNVLESRIAVLDNTDQERKSRTRDGEVQTDETKDPRGEADRFKDESRSTLGQPDARVFRIENIFQDPNSVSRRTDVAVDGARMRKSITFRNSLGTSYVSQSRENDAVDLESNGKGFIRDGLITEAFITKKRSFGKGFDRVVHEDSWRKWPAPEQASKIRPVAHDEGLLSPSWQSQTELPAAGLILSCSSCAPSADQASAFRRSKVDSGRASGTFESKAFPSSATAEVNSNVEHDHSFSDDSLDYSENNILGQTVLKMADLEQRESLCPPDVVAHTKKDCPKLSNAIEAESNESSGDFEDSHVEFPKMKPTEDGTELLRIHDYESLILGRPCYSSEDRKEDTESSLDPLNNNGKKKVSFSSSTEFQDKVTPAEQSPRQSSKATLRSIIKKRKKRNASDLPQGVQSSNDETDDSQQEEKGVSGMESNCKRQVLADNTEETSKEDVHPDLKTDSTQNHKKVKFFKIDAPKAACNESDSCENPEDDEEDVPRDRVAKDILEEYFSEAVTFMRNLNSINRYANAASVLDRYPSTSHRKHVGKQGSRRRDYSFPWNRDQLDQPERKIDFTDKTDDCPKEDDEIIVSTESYDRCLKGIQRLEDCIRRVDRHNELLRVKYGVNCGSAGARPSLASPSTDRAPDSSSPRLFDYQPRSSPRPIDDSSVAKDEDEDLQKRIFDQLMNVANATSCRGSSKLRSRFASLSDRRPRSPLTYSKLRERYNHSSDESFCRDVQGSLDVDEISGNSAQDCASYEITGNLSVARVQESFDDAESALQEDFFPLRRFDRIEAKLRVDENTPARTQRDDSWSGLSRSGKADSGIAEDDSLGLKSKYTQRAPTVDTRERLQEPDDCSRRIRDATLYACAKSQDSEGSNENLQFREKLKYPGSPRARFLELLRERRRIVESSRGTSAS
nr:centromere-associated protein E-like [Nomia melanderi]